MTNPRSSESLVERLFERNNELEVTGAMLKAAKSSDELNILLKHAPDMWVTQDVLEVAASKYSRGQELVTLLLKQDKTVKVPPAVLCGTSARYLDQVLYITTLLEHDPDLHITGEVLSAIVSGRGSDEDKQRLAELLLRYEKRVDFTEEVRTAIDEKFQGHSHKDLKALFYKLERKNT